MKSLHSENVRQEVAGRVGHVAKDAVAQWGKFNAPQMVAHLADAMRMATGELEVRPKPIFVRFPPFKQLLIYVLPMPKNLPTAKELITRGPSSWSGEVDDFLGLLDRFGRRDAVSPWPPHPIFGSMSRRDWGALAYKHIDHHLRQFGA